MSMVALPCPLYGLSCPFPILGIWHVQPATHPAYLACLHSILPAVYQALLLAVHLANLARHAQPAHLAHCTSGTFIFHAPGQFGLPHTSHLAHSGYHATGQFNPPGPSMSSCSRYIQPIAHPAYQACRPPGASRRQEQRAPPRPRPLLGTPLNWYSMHSPYKQSD